MSDQENKEPMTQGNDLSFEEAFNKLEQIVDILEKGEKNLEESISLYEKGIRLAKFCSQKLNDAETRLQKLIKNEDGSFQLEPME